MWEKVASLNSPGDKILLDMLYLRWQENSPVDIRIYLEDVLALRRGSLDGYRSTYPDLSAVMKTLSAPAAGDLYRVKTAGEKPAYCLILDPVRPAAVVCGKA